MIEIVVKNFASTLRDADLLKALPDFQTQMSRDVGPVWGCDTKLTFAPKDAFVPATTWTLACFDEIDVAGALGYHDIAKNGCPLGKVGIKTTRDDGGLWQVTFSHELVEMRLDPWIGDTVIDPTKNRLYAKEACDACEADSLSYKIGSTPVSDFVTPKFWMRGVSASGPLSFAGHIKHAFDVLPEGYLSYIDLSRPSAGWLQVNAQKRKGGSRGARRAALHAGASPAQSTEG